MKIWPFRLTHSSWAFLAYIHLRIFISALISIRAFRSEHFLKLSILTWTAKNILIFFRDLRNYHYVKHLLYLRQKNQGGERGRSKIVFYGKVENLKTVDGLYWKQNTCYQTRNHLTIRWTGLFYWAFGEGITFCKEGSKTMWPKPEIWSNYFRE